MDQNKTKQNHIKVFGHRNFKILRKLICRNNFLKIINKKWKIKIRLLKLLKIIIFIMIRIIDKKIKI